MKIFNPFKQGIEDLKSWLNAHLELIQLKGVKKAVEVSSKVTFSLFILIFMLLGFSFLSIALALFIGQLLDSYALGFLITGAIPLLIIGLMYLFKKSTYGFLLNFFTRIFTKQWKDHLHHIKNF